MVFSLSSSCSQRDGRLCWGQIVGVQNQIWGCCWNCIILLFKPCFFGEEVVLFFHPPPTTITVRIHHKEAWLQLCHHHKTEEFVLCDSETFIFVFNISRSTSVQFCMRLSYIHMRTHAPTRTHTHPSTKGTPVCLCDGSMLYNFWFCVFWVTPLLFVVLGKCFGRQVTLIGFLLYYYALYLQAL